MPWGGNYSLGDVGEISKQPSVRGDAFHLNRGHFDGRGPRSIIFSVGGLGQSRHRGSMGQAFYAPASPHFHSARRGEHKQVRIDRENRNQPGQKAIANRRLKGGSNAIRFHRTNGLNSRPTMYLLHGDASSTVGRSPPFYRGESANDSGSFALPRGRAQPAR